MWQSTTFVASQDRAGRGLGKPIGEAGNIANLVKQRVESKNGPGQVRKPDVAKHCPEHIHQALIEMCTVVQGKVCMMLWMPFNPA